MRVRPVLTCVAAAALAFSTAAGAATSRVEENVAGETEQRVLELTADAGWRFVRAHVETRVRRGWIAFRLVDPEGAERMSGRCDNGRMSLESGEIEAMPGVWRLELTLDGTHGDYRVDWNGS